MSRPLRRVAVLLGLLGGGCHGSSGAAKAEPAACGDAAPACPGSLACVGGRCLDPGLATRRAVVRVSQGAGAVYGAQLVLGYPEWRVAFPETVGCTTAGGSAAARASGGELRVAFARANPIAPGEEAAVITFYALVDDVSSRDLSLRGSRIVDGDGRPITGTVTVE